MENMEEISFNIITYSGQAKANVMAAIDASRKFTGDKAEIKALVTEARNHLKTAQESHFKVLSQYAKDQVNIIDPLYMHAEDQIMSAETFLDFANELIETNIALYELRSRLK